MAFVRASNSSGGGAVNNKYQTIASHSGSSYIIIGQGDILKIIPSMSADQTYEDDNIRYSIVNFYNGTWAVVNKKACKYRQNNGAVTQLSANSSTSCSYTGGIYEFDFN